MTKNRRLFLGVLFAAVASGCSTLSFDESGERWRDNYCLKEPLDRACKDRTPPYGDSVTSAPEQDGSWHAPAKLP
ncbi:hypothetical protein [Hyphococcus sp.]|jgi:hypothetical protein|uniref:hypothetical protein n=1 Tax=Hyphococcus sp. TaxID=2038636 RepID=UPI003D10847B